MTPLGPAPSAERWPGESLAESNIRALDDPEHQRRGAAWRKRRDEAERARQRAVEADEWRRRG